MNSVVQTEKLETNKIYAEISSASLGYIKEVKDNGEILFNFYFPEIVEKTITLEELKHEFYYFGCDITILDR